MILSILKLLSTVYGEIRFENVALRYSPALPLAIENVSFRIEPGSRIAIVGRTGSGKSSLIQALLRANPICSFLYLAIFLL